MKILFPLAIVALGSIPILPTEWLQLGVAGAALSILFWFITKTHPKALRDERESNEKNITALWNAQNATTERIVNQLGVTADRQMRLMEKALDTEEDRGLTMEGK
jgi:hypothetical protein